MKCCMQLIQAGGLPGDLPLPAMIQEKRLRDGVCRKPKRQKQDFREAGVGQVPAPQVCAHTHEVSFYFSLPLGSGKAPCYLVSPFKPYL